MFFTLGYFSNYLLIYFWRNKMRINEIFYDNLKKPKYKIFNDSFKIVAPFLLTNNV